MTCRGIRSCRWLSTVYEADAFQAAEYRDKTIRLVRNTAINNHCRRPGRQLTTISDKKSRVVLGHIRQCVMKWRNELLQTPKICSALVCGVFLYTIFRPFGRSKPEATVWTVSSACSWRKRS